MVTALITGAAGFCSGHLVRRLRADRDLHIVGTDIAPTTPALNGLHAYIQADVRDAAAISRLVEEVRPDVVYHLAGLIRGPAASIFAVNVQGGVNVMEALREYAPNARMLAVGSAAEYGNARNLTMPITEGYPGDPTGAYAISKYAFTLSALDYARLGNLKTVVVRPFNLLGAGIPSTLVVGAILQRAKAALAKPGPAEVVIGNLDTERDFLAVEDAVEAYCRLLDGEFWGQVFNICSGQPHSIRFVIEELLSHADRSVTVRVDPALVRADDVPVVYGSFEKAKAAIGFTPTIPLKSALRAAWNDSMERDV